MPEARRVNWRTAGGRAVLEVSRDPDGVLASVVQSLVVENGPRSSIEAILSPDGLGRYDTGAAGASRMRTAADWADLYSSDTDLSELPDPAVQEVWLCHVDFPMRRAWVTGSELRILFARAWPERPPPNPGARFAVVPSPRATAPIRPRAARWLGDRLQVDGDPSDVIATVLLGMLHDPAGRAAVEAKLGRSGRGPWGTGECWARRVTAGFEWDDLPELPGPLPDPRRTETWVVCAHAPYRVAWLEAEELRRLFAQAADARPPAR